MDKFLWVLNGEGGTFPVGIFDERQVALNYIQSAKLTDVLTKYPINISLIDHCLSEGLFELKDKELSPKLIQRFSSAHLEHIHFKKGKVG